MPPRRFLIADRQPLFRSALRQLIEGQLAPASIGEAASPAEIGAWIEQAGHPDLLLVDPCSWSGEGPELLAELMRSHPGLPIVVVSATGTATGVARLAAKGVRGYVPKSATAEEFLAALVSALAGETAFPEWAQAREREDAGDIASLVATLSRQQVRVLRLLGEGLLNKQIAYGLGIGETTVKAHISAILKKLGASNRTQVAMMVSRLPGYDWQRSAARAYVVRSDTGGVSLGAQGGPI